MASAKKTGRKCYFLKYLKETCKAKKKVTYNRRGTLYLALRMILSNRKIQKKHQFLKLWSGLCHTYKIFIRINSNISSSEQRTSGHNYFLLICQQLKTPTSINYIKHLLYELHLFHCSATMSRLPALSLASELSWSTVSLDEDLSDI